MLTDRYQLGELVGVGGAADVYEGTDLLLGRSVAVKVFRPGTDALLEERFHDEAVLLARLQHPGLVTVYDAGRHESRSYLIMQLVQGPTLRQELAGTPMTPESVARLGGHLADALAHVHAAGIVHRDIKPSNILLDAERKPYLTDFGISRLIDATTQTAPDVLIGTAAYLAPEQVLGKGAGSAADIYSLGLLLLECLKGELEYSGPPMEAAIARLHRPPVIPDDVPAPLVGLLRDMTSADEAVRPDAQDCTTALTDYAMDLTPASADPTSHLTVGEHVEGDRLTPLSPSPRGVPPPPPTRASLPRRTRTLLIGGTTLIALVGATLTTAALLPGGTSEQKAPASPSSPSVRPGTGTPSAGSSAPGPVRQSAGQPSADPPGSVASPGAPSPGQNSRSSEKAEENAGQGGEGNAGASDAPGLNSRKGAADTGPASTGKEKRQEGKASEKSGR
ncbi:protein kinase [Streptomyces finlayi]|uniref:Protein kinase n=1 Tax=Streptomyces finlayi TaxID=67296 RepID=A0A7G7BQJ6_9ACTN|nr:serine/threonine-protein kinase [Streptomyces finlayi]QNE77611.1 protein kinase [Streptomyces finlayi]